MGRSQYDIAGSFDTTGKADIIVAGRIATCYVGGVDVAQNLSGSRFLVVRGHSVNIWQH